MQYSSSYIVDADIVSHDHVYQVHHSSSSSVLHSVAASCQDRLDWKLFNCGRCDTVVFFNWKLGVSPLWKLCYVIVQ